MEKRYTFTKIWEDDWFSNLSRAGKLLFHFSFTNSKIGYTGFYEMPDRVIIFCTGLTANELVDTKKELYPKVRFHEGWIFVPNAEKFEPIKGENNPLWKAYAKELDRLPEEIKRVLEGANEGLTRPSEGSLGTGNGNGLVKDESVREEKTFNKYSKLSEITEEEVRDIANGYQVPETFVQSKLDDLSNYCSSKGKTYRNYLSTLKLWVKKDAMERKENAKPNRRIVAIDPS